MSALENSCMDIATYSSIPTTVDVAMQDGSASQPLNWEALAGSIHFLKPNWPCLPLSDEQLLRLWGSLCEDAREMAFNDGILPSGRASLRKRYDCFVERFQTGPENAKVRQVVRTAVERLANASAAIRAYRDVEMPATNPHQMAPRAETPNGPTLKRKHESSDDDRQLPYYFDPPPACLDARKRARRDAPLGADEEAQYAEVRNPLLLSHKLGVKYRRAVLSVGDHAFTGKFWPCGPTADYRIDAAVARGGYCDKLLLRLVLSVAPDGQPPRICTERSYDHKYVQAVLRYRPEDMLAVREYYYQRSDVRDKMSIPPEMVAGLNDPSKIYCLEFTPSPRFFEQASTQIAARMDPLLFCDGALEHLRSTVAALFTPDQRIRLCYLAEWPDLGVELS